MQPDDLAKKILERGFLSSQEVIGAAGEVSPPAPVPAPVAAPRASRVPWQYLALAVVGGVSVFVGVLLARSIRPDTLPSPVPSDVPAEPPRPAVQEIVGGPRMVQDPEDALADVQKRLATHPLDVDALTMRASLLSLRARHLKEGPDQDKADEEARDAAAQCFQADPARPDSAELLWRAHEPIRKKLASLGAPALAQRVQALATLRDATSQTLARNPNDPTCHEVVGAASLELGDALLAAGRKAQALEMWQQAAVIQPTLRPEVEKRMKAAGR